jgi:hypothetical protein
MKRHNFIVPVMAACGLVLVLSGTACVNHSKISSSETGNWFRSAKIMVMER